jgi:hypothetical protein
LHQQSSGHGCTHTRSKLNLTAKGEQEISPQLKIATEIIQNSKEAADDSELRFGSNPKMRDFYFSRMFHEYSSKLDFSLTVYMIDLFVTEFVVWVDHAVVDKGYPFRFVGLIIGLCSVILITVKKLRTNTVIFKSFLSSAMSLRLIMIIIELFVVKYTDLLREEDKLLR